ncbi:MAG: hypothetical protein QM711_15050 [Micropruina sp.]|uniref:hypothetical protein n=1 Tax=Micropruina sp. TaxID=2737536 RepID=UPI0039E6E861
MALSDWLNLLGALVTALGLVVVAPEALGTVARQLMAGAAHLARRARGQLARWFPSLGKSTSATVGAVAASLLGIASNARGRIGPTDIGDHAQQLDQLRRVVAAIYAELDELHAAHEQLKAEQSARLDALTAELAAVQQALREQEDEQRKLNGKGFPLAALGLLPSSVPVDVLNGPTGWAVLALLGGFAVVGARWLAEARGDIAKGWREAAASR